MHELITHLTEKAGLTTDQAEKALHTVKEYVKEKFPMMAGAVDNLFGAPSVTDSTAVVDAAAPVVPHNVLDKISNVIPGETGEKVEEFVKDSAAKVEDVFDQLKDKVGNFFGGDKK